MLIEEGKQNLKLITKYDDAHPHTSISQELFRHIQYLIFIYEQIDVCLFPCMSASVCRRCSVFAYEYDVKE